MPNQQQEKLLRSLGIVQLEKDVRSMTRDELAEHFSSARSGRIVLAPLIRSVIWQAFKKIQEGTEDLGGGNIRSFWYRWLQPTLAHFSDDDSHRTRPYRVMSEMFSEMVLKHKLFRYQDFDFSDDNWNNRLIGSSRADVLVYAEKTGWMRFLQRIHRDFSCSVLCLGGFPSALTSEYTTTALQQKIGKETSVRLVGLVDFDYSGDLIAESFREQLIETGLNVSSMVTLIHPDHYTTEELEMFKIPLPRRQKTKLEAWMKKTDGIDGEVFGLEAESMPIPRLRQLVEKEILEES